MGFLLVEISGETILEQLEEVVPILQPPRTYSSTASLGQRISINGSYPVVV